MIVRLLLEARLDIFEASRFYDRQKDGLGDYFVSCIFQDIERLERFAGIHEKRGNYCRLISERFPFMICYQLASNEFRSSRCWTADRTRLRSLVGSAMTKRTIKRIHPSCRSGVS